MWQRVKKRMATGKKYQNDNSFHSGLVTIVSSISLELFDDVSAPPDTKSYYGILPFITEVIGHSVIPFCDPYCQNLPGNNRLGTTGFNFIILYNYFLVLRRCKYFIESTKAFKKLSRLDTKTQLFLLDVKVLLFMFMNCQQTFKKVEK